MKSKPCDGGLPIATLDSILDGPRHLSRAATAWDYNSDGVLNEGDAAGYVTCLQGPTGALLPTCAILDLNGDNHVDLRDVAQFQDLAGE